MSACTKFPLFSTWVFPMLSYGEQSKLWIEIDRHETRHAPWRLKGTPATRTSPWFPHSSGQDVNFRGYLR